MTAFLASARLGDFSLLCNGSLSFPLLQVHESEYFYFASFAQRGWNLFGGYGVPLLLYPATGQDLA